MNTTTHSAATVNKHKQTNINTHKHVVFTDVRLPARLHRRGGRPWPRAHPPRRASSCLNCCLASCECFEREVSMKPRFMRSTLSISTSSGASSVLPSVTTRLAAERTRSSTSTSARPTRHPPARDAYLPSTPPLGLAACPTLALCRRPESRSFRISDSVLLLLFVFARYQFFSRRKNTPQLVIGCNNAMICSEMDIYNYASV